MGGFIFVRGCWRSTRVRGWRVGARSRRPRGPRGVRRCGCCVRCRRMLMGDGFVASAMSVLELGNEWAFRARAAAVKAGCRAGCRGTFYLHVAPVLGAMRVDDCGPEAIRGLLSAKRGEGVGEAGIAKLRRMLHALFAFAQDAGLVSVNPVDSARANGRPRLHRARGTGSRGCRSSAFSVPARRAGGRFLWSRSIPG